MVLACDTWDKAGGNICSQYTLRFVEVLQKQGYTVTQACGTVQEDFGRMVRAPVLISGGIGSSLSYMAALASKHTAILPTTISASGQRPNMKNHNYKTRPGLTFLHDDRLPHAEVIDYRKVDVVHKQLLSESGHEKISTPTHDIVVIIPFRDRHEHYEEFMLNWKRNTSIIVVEQDNKELYRRAWSTNIGIQIAMEMYPNATCIVQNDIDFLPDGNVNYTECITPIQLSSEIECFGGSCAICNLHRGGDKRQCTSLGANQWND